MTAILGSLQPVQSALGMMAIDGRNETTTKGNLTSQKYIRWDDSRVESVPDGEAEDIQAVAELINKAQSMMYNNHRHCFGGWCGQMLNFAGTKLM
jgi:hypothetical protein